MSGMHQVGLVLQQVVYAFDDAPFPEHDSVPHGHELVFHVGLEPVDEMDALVEKLFKEGLLYISSAGEDLPVEFPGEDGPHTPVPVIHVCPGKTKSDYVSAVIAQQMQLESVTPSHGALPVLGHILEHLVRVAAQIVADGYHRGVHETDAAAFSEGPQLQEEHQGEERAGHQLDKAVVGDGIGEIAGQMPPYV